MGYDIQTYQLMRDWSVVQEGIQLVMQVVINRAAQTLLLAF